MGNEVMRRNWSDGAAGWVANEAIFDSVFAPVTTAIIAAAAPAPGRRVLDVGCGSGTLLAASSAAGAATVGVDIAPGMAEAARARVPEAVVVTADAQVADLLALAPGPPFDAVVSRFGVMFFDDPVAAFANLRRSSAPGARLAFMCWRGKEHNPMFGAGTALLGDRLDPPSTYPPPGEPGPMAFVDGDRTASLLSAAGWGEVAVEPFAFTCDFGMDGSDGVEERLSTILAGGTGRLAREQLRPALGAEGWDALVEEVRADLRRHRVDGVLRFPASTWLVSAVNR